MYVWGGGCNQSLRKNETWDIVLKSEFALLANSEEGRRSGVGYYQEQTYLPKTEFELSQVGGGGDRQMVA